MSSQEISSPISTNTESTTHLSGRVSSEVIAPYGSRSDDTNGDQNSLYVTDLEYSRENFFRAANTIATELTDNTTHLNISF
ncbi:MAG: hypothetical protein EXX96DRAFT_618865 [Benjaminiella poitrasii]|nr:MAG: hypothetical protein EXX96DRAFT_618865 [Benjaminiella poitrasii]